MLDHYNLKLALEESHVLMIVSDLQAGLKETSGEIKLFVNQNMSPGKREYTLTIRRFSAWESYQ